MIFESVDGNLPTKEGGMRNLVLQDKPCYAMEVTLLDMPWTLCNVVRSNNQLEVVQSLD